MTSSAYIFASASLAEDVVAVHGVEVELGRIDHEMVVKVVRREAFEEVPAAIECHLNRPPAAHAGPRFRALGGKSHAAGGCPRAQEFLFLLVVGDRRPAVQHPAARQMRYGDRTDRGAI